MLNETETLGLIRRLVDALSEEQRKTVIGLAEKIRAIVESSEFGPVALGLVGAEYAAKE